MKQPIEIEALLTWAYRDQCVDRMLGQMRKAIAGGRTGIGMSGGQAIWALGTRIDSAPALLTAIGATAPDDALIVHDAVLALGDLWVETGRDADGDYVCVWEKGEIEAAGWRLRETARGWMIARPDARAMSMWSDVAVSRAVTTALVVRHAKAGDRPEVYADWRPPRGRPRRDETMAGDVIHSRAVYQVWREALAVLAEELDGALAGFAVTGVLPAEAPWEDARARMRSAWRRMGAAGSDAGARRTAAQARAAAVRAGRVSRK